MFSWNKRRQVLFYFNFSRKTFHYFIRIVLQGQLGSRGTMKCSWTEGMLHVSLFGHSCSLDGFAKPRVLGESFDSWRMNKGSISFGVIFRSMQPFDRTASWRLSSVIILTQHRNASQGKATAYIQQQKNFPRARIAMVMERSSIIPPLFWPRRVFLAAGGSFQNFSRMLGYPITLRDVSRKKATLILQGLARNLWWQKMGKSQNGPYQRLLSGNCLRFSRDRRRFHHVSSTETWFGECSKISDGIAIVMARHIPIEVDLISSNEEILIRQIELG